MILSPTRMIAGEKHTIDKLNRLGSRRVPFLFVIDFEKKTPWICPLDELEAEAVLFDANGISNCIPPPAGSKKLDFTVDAVD
ncbi:MAG: hypothetical protein L3J31_01285, partial [Bacteroidales bacterium]|nr:hypothetical protein [Bacteroidales bacterium]